LPLPSPTSRERDGRARGKTGWWLSIAKPVISTFHSFACACCGGILKLCGFLLQCRTATIGLTKNFVIYDESDQQQVVKGVMRGWIGRQRANAAHRTVAISWPRTTCSTRRKFICSRQIRRRAHCPRLRGISQGTAQGERDGLRRLAARSGASVEVVARCANTTIGDSSICSSTNIRIRTARSTS